MSRMGFEPSIPVFEWANTFRASDCVATVIDPVDSNSINILTHAMNESRYTSYLYWLIEKSHNAYLRSSFLVCFFSCTRSFGCRSFLLLFQIYTKLVGAVCYKPEDRGFETRCHLIFFNFI
jgi:hypothetical protein